MIVSNREIFFGFFGKFIKLISLNWFLLVLLFILSSIGVLTLYSASGGNMEPWAKNHIIRFLLSLSLAIFIGIINIKFWFKLSYFAYFIGLLLLILVEFIGLEFGGAKRWVDIKFFYIQPSEIMKISVILALARYFSECGDIRSNWIKTIFFPAILIITPILLVLSQPDLGTALLLLFSSLSVIYVAGISYWVISCGVFISVISLPFAWSFLHDYQRERIYTFLSPERDPLGSGYHIIQSKIAIGSGSFWGKGWLQGSQSHLDFIPEIHTDFVFSIFSEEFGFFGSLLILILYSSLTFVGLFISYNSKDYFTRLLTFGLSITIFLYFFSNIAMVMGIIPVVGVPLPLISYGGSAMITIMTAIGLIMSSNIYNKSIKEQAIF